jgi:hypothetical protein
MTLPAFSAEASLYKVATAYRLATGWGKGSEMHLSPAQLVHPPACFFDQVDTSICKTGCQQTCVSGGNETFKCVSSDKCGLPSLQCGDCLLPTDGIRQKVLAGQPIDPATDLVFQQTCTQGSQTFTRNCVKCSSETKISIPWPGSDKCVSVCLGGFDPSLINIVTRDC